MPSPEIRRAALGLLADMAVSAQREDAEQALGWVAVVVDLESGEVLPSDDGKVTTSLLEVKLIQRDGWQVHTIETVAKGTAGRGTYLVARAGPGGL